MFLVNMHYPKTELNIPDKTKKKSAWNYPVTILAPRVSGYYIKNRVQKAILNTVASSVVAILQK